MNEKIARDQPKDQIIENWKGMLAADGSFSLKKRKESLMSRGKMERR